MCQGSRFDDHDSAPISRATGRIVRKEGCAGVCARCPLNDDFVARVMHTIAAPETLFPEPRQGHF